MIGNTDILIIDDEADIRGLVQGILEDEGYQTRLAANSSQAYDAVKAKTPDLIILDIWLQGSDHDGMDILKNIKADHPDLPILMISGHGSIETAVTSIKYGAYDFIEKPFKSDRLLLMIRRALETATLRVENKTLRQKYDVVTDFIGQSPQIQNIRQALQRVAVTNSRVLLTGNAGTGKDLAAHYIHQNSGRSSHPFMVLNCSTIEADQLEIELFGMEGKNGTGASKSGLLEQAHTGTLLLDEISEMPLGIQSKLIRFLQNSKFYRVGGQTMQEVDVRIIASTRVNLEDRIKNGTFKEDLYYRLNVVPIHIPTLKDRVQDIPLLVENFSAQIASKTGQNQPEFTGAALAALQDHDWPGNIRQLRNVIEWVLIMHGDHDVIGRDELPGDITGQAPSTGDDTQKDGGNGFSMRARSDYMGAPLREAREAFEKEYLVAQIGRFGGNISKTAQFVGMERSALHRKMKSLDIVPGQSKSEGAMLETDLSSMQDKDSNIRSLSDAKMKRA